MTYVVKDDQSGFVREDEVETPISNTITTTSHGVPQLGEADFPFLGTASRRDLATQLQADPLQNRILYLSGIHPNATDEDIRACLNSFPIADIKRNVHPRNGKYLPTAFILLKSAKDRSLILQQMKGFNMHSRFVSIEAPRKVVNGILSFSFADYINSLSQRLPKACVTLSCLKVY